MTTIQRKYSLPNCTLLVEGLSPANEPLNVRPLISVLVNAECHLVGAKQPLMGGRDFFESLVTAVSGYAQEFLSQVPHPEAHRTAAGFVQLQQIDHHRHRLIVQGDANQNGTSPITLDLTTVQLFDLIEAVDQFFADSRTLPDIALQLEPVSKRNAGHSPQLAKQAVPATVGVSSLALAAIAFFFVPIPEVQRPVEPQPQSSRRNLSATVITDQAQIATLQQKLHSQIRQTWKSKVNEDLVYRLSVTKDGTIVGYRSISATASDAIAQTPLPNLLAYPVADATLPDAIAQFQVVFSRNNKLQITPWQ